MMRYIVVYTKPVFQLNVGMYRYIKATKKKKYIGL